MPEPFKNVFDTDFVNRLIVQIKSCYEDFNNKAFIRAIFDERWEARELKQRIRHISVCMRKYLPEELTDAYAVIRQVAINFGEKMDFAQMVFPDFVEYFGLEHPESLELLQHLTHYSSSEFAVRPFILRDQARVMKIMNEWALYDNYHVRRCASEGVRPRLPWAMALPALKIDPRPILPILERLKNDSELFKYR